MDQKSIELFIETQIGQDALRQDKQTQIQLLKSRFRRLFIIMAVNLIFVVLFAYSFFYGITQLSSTWLNLIVVVFILNVFFLGLQWKKLKQAISYLSNK